MYLQGVCRVCGCNLRVACVGCVVVVPSSDNTTHNNPTKVKVSGPKWYI